MATMTMHIVCSSRFAAKFRLCYSGTRACTYPGVRPDMKKAVQIPRPKFLAENISAKVRDS